MVVAKRDILVAAAKHRRIQVSFYSKRFRPGYNGDSFLGMIVVRQDRGPARSLPDGSVEFTQSLRLWRD